MTSVTLKVGSLEGTGSISGFKPGSKNPLNLNAVGDGVCSFVGSPLGSIELDGKKLDVCCKLSVWLRPHKASSIPGNAVEVAI